MQNNKKESDGITVSNSMVYWSFKWFKVILFLIVCISFLVMVHNGKFNAILHSENEACFYRAHKNNTHGHQCNYDHEELHD